MYYVCILIVQYRGILPRLSVACIFAVNIVPLLSVSLGYIIDSYSGGMVLGDILGVYIARLRLHDAGACAPPALWPAALLVRRSPHPALWLAALLRPAAFMNEIKYRCTCYTFLLFSLQ